MQSSYLNPALNLFLHSNFLMCADGPHHHAGDPWTVNSAGFFSNNYPSVFPSGGGGGSHFAGTGAPSFNQHHAKDAMVL